MPMMIVQFKLEEKGNRKLFGDNFLEEKNPAKIPRIGAGGRHTNIVLGQSCESPREGFKKEVSPPKQIKSETKDEKSK